MNKDKALEVLKRLKMYVDCCECDYISNPNEDYEIVEKELKVVDIIRRFPGFIHWTFLEKLNSEEIELINEVFKHE